MPQKGHQTTSRSSRRRRSSNSNRHHPLRLQPNMVGAWAEALVALAGRTRVLAAEATAETIATEAAVVEVEAL